MTAITARLTRARLVVLALPLAVVLGAAAGARAGASPGHVALGAVAVAIAAALAYVLWHRDPAWTFSLGLALSVFSGYSHQLHLPVGPDRLLLAFGVLRLAWEAWRARRGARAGVTPPPIRFGAVQWLMLVTLAYATLSALWAGTFGTSTGFYALVDRLGLMPFLMFTLAGRVFGTPEQRRILILTLTVVGAYLGLTALFEAVHLNALVWPRYILDPTIGYHAERARGPFAEPGADGLGLAICGVAAAIGVRRWRGVARVAAAGVVVLCVLGVLFTLTRAVWLGAAAGVLVTLVAFRELRRFALPAVVGMVVIVAAALVLVPGLAANVNGREHSQSPVWDRLNTNAAALRLVHENPIAGIGWSTFPTKSIAALRQSPDYPLTGAGIEVHNVLLSYLVELGVVGAALWVATFLLAFSSLLAPRPPPQLEPWRVGLCVIAVLWIVAATFGPVPYAFPSLVLWLWAGIVYEATRVPRPAPTGAVAVTGRGRAALVG